MRRNSAADSKLHTKREVSPTPPSRRTRSAKAPDNSGTGGATVVSERQRRREQASPPSGGPPLFAGASPKEGLLVARQDPSTFFLICSLADCTSSVEYIEVLRKKLAVCRDVVFDFRYQFPGSDVEPYAVEKDGKRQTLNEILDYVIAPDQAPPEVIADDLIKAVAANLFRPLPPPSGTAVCSLYLSVDPEEGEPNLEPSWPHLQLVYEILLRFVMSADLPAKAAKRCIETSFVLKLLDLFASEDPRERDYLKTVMHRIYGKVMALRSFIRKAMQNVFYRYIHEAESCGCNGCGVSELLEILGSIINGFAQPLKDEHKIFLRTSMIPLHKTRHLVNFHQQLTYCMTQYIEKDPKLVEPIIMGLLRYWPVANTPKEVLFLNEVEEILELSHAEEFQKIAVPLFQRLGQCIVSPHFQVSERTLFFWNNARVVKLITQFKTQLYPIIVVALHDNCSHHWNQTVQGLTVNVCKLLSDADYSLFNQISDEYTGNEERRRRLAAERAERWRALEEQLLVDSAAAHSL